MKYIHLDEVESTNTYAKKNLTVLEDKTVIVAKRQTAGRGRLLRSWLDFGGENVFLTFVLKPSKVFVQTYSSLTQYLAVILAKHLETYGVTAQIKWPNDVLVEGKKIAGILSETSMQGNTFNGLVLGVGVNLNAPQDKLKEIDKPATALNIETGKQIDKKEFIEKLVEEFFISYDEFLAKGFDFIRQYYIKRAMFLGKELEIDVLGDIMEGVAKDLTSQGELILNVNGEDKTVRIGDIL